MKKISISIPKPCHENWNGMTPQDKGRFCASCQKTVIDFSTMSDRQLADFFKKPVGSVCGHFSNTQLNRQIDIPKKRMPWVRYFFTMALPAFLLSLKGSAQGEPRLRGKIAVKTQYWKKDTCEKPVIVPAVPSSLTGKVVDENGLPLQGAIVQIAGKNVATLTDSNGVYNLHVIESGEVALLISYVGYETKKILVKDAATKDAVLVPLVGTLSGELVVTMGMVAYKPAEPIPVLKPEKRDTAFSKFVVYPNPIAAGSTISIDTRKMEPGNYAVHLLNSAGELLQSSNIIVEKKTTKQSLALGQVAPGPHFLRLTNKKSGKSFTEIIIVQ